MYDPFQSVTGIIERIQKSNALYPLLIALFLCLALAGTAFLTGNTYAICGMLIIVFILVCGLIHAYIYLMRNNPDMLRTESHVIQRQALNLIGDSMHGVSASPADVLAILNPEAPMLEMGTRQKQGADGDEKESV